MTGWLLVIGILTLLIYFSKSVIKYSIGLNIESIGIFTINGISYNGIFVKSISLEFGKHGKIIVLGINSLEMEMVVEPKKKSKPLKIPYLPYLVKYFGIIVRNASMEFGFKDIKVKLDIEEAIIGINWNNEATVLDLGVIGLRIKESETILSSNLKVQVRDLKDIMKNPKLKVELNDFSLDLPDYSLKEFKEKGRKTASQIISDINNGLNMVKEINPRIKLVLKNAKVNAKVNFYIKDVELDFMVQDKVPRFQARINEVLGGLKGFQLLDLEKLSLDLKFLVGGSVNILLDNMVIYLNQETLKEFQSTRKEQGNSLNEISTVFSYYRIQTKLKLSKSEILFSFLQEKMVSVGFLLDSTEVVFDAVDETKMEEKAIGNGQVFLNGISLDVFTHVNESRKLKYNLTSCSYAHAHIGVYAFNSSGLKFHIQGAFEAIQINLSGIRDDSSIEYKKLFKTIKQILQGNQRKDLGLKVNGILDIPMILVDCKSDIPSTSVRMEVRDVSLKFNISELKELTSNVSLSNLSLIIYKGIKFSEIYRPVKNTLLVIPGITAEIITSPGKIPSFSVNTEQVQVGVNLSDIYVCIISFQHIIKIIKSLKSIENTPRPQMFNFIGKFVSKNLELKWQLANDVMARFEFSPLRFHFLQASVELEIDDVLIEANSSSHKHETLCKLLDINATIRCHNDNSHPIFSIMVNSRFLHLNVPHDYKLENVFENMINISKAVKNLAIEHLEFVPDPYCLEGKTIIDPLDIPQIKICVQELLFSMQDDPFEVALNNNYVFGCDEQQSRISRSKEFAKLARLRKEQGDYDA